jgi:multidrug efflux system outer membrane protein
MTNASMSARASARLRNPTLPLFALAALLSASCASVDEHDPQSAVQVPAAWHETSAGLRAEPAELARWWGRWDDPLLASLVERAALGSLDLRQAVARMREARAWSAIAGGERLPSIDARAAYQRVRNSQNTAFSFTDQDYDVFSAGFDASWELDLWGRVAHTVAAAEADFEASVEDARDVALSSAAQAAASYVDVRALQRRLELARGNLDLQQQTVQLVRGRFEAGLVGERDLAQALTNLESTRARIPPLEGALRAAENRLAVLVGLAPGALAQELAQAAPIPKHAGELALGVPAELLRRRPDVRRAERALVAEHARRGIAEAERLPRFTLGGTLGFESEEPGDLIESASSAFGLGPSLRWTLFDGGRLRQRVEVQDARVEQAQLRWEHSILLALEEAENALTSWVREDARRGALQAAAQQARRAVEFARTQYREGVADFQTVLDSERALTELDDALAQSEGALAAGLVSIYAALGGGWEGELDPLQALAAH